MRALLCTCTAALLATAATAQAPAAGDYAVHCGKLYLGDGNVMAPAWIVVQGGKILAVQATPPAAELRVVDASRKVVMPGIVAADNDVCEAADSTYNVTPDVMALDAFDFGERQRDALQGGVTTAYLSPGRQRLVSGQGAVVKMAGADFVGRVLRELPDGSPLPWHRVVNASGAFGLRGSAAAEQRRRLKREGVEFDSRGRVLRAHFVFARARSGGGDELR